MRVIEKKGLSPEEQEASYYARCKGARIHAAVAVFMVIVLIFISIKKIREKKYRTVAILAIPLVFGVYRTFYKMPSFGGDVDSWSNRIIVPCKERVEQMFKTQPH